MGVFYDCYKIIRQIWRPKVWGTILGDAIFWIINTILTYLFLLLFIWGEVRFYVFLAMAIGVVLYLKFCSRFVSFLLLNAYLVCVRFLSSIFKLLALPILLVWRLVLIPCRFFTIFIVLVIKGLRQVKGMVRLVITHQRGSSPPPPDDSG